MASQSISAAMSATVLITGAGTGFGRDAAERLARRGHRVFATMRQIDGDTVGHRRNLELLVERRLATDGHLGSCHAQCDRALPDSLQHEVPVLGTPDQQQGLFCNVAPTNVSGDLPGNLFSKLATFLWTFPLP